MIPIPSLICTNNIRNEYITSIVYIITIEYVLLK